MSPAIEFAVSVVQDQTRRIRRRLRKNRSRICYQVETDDGRILRVYRFCRAVILAGQYGGWIFQGKQNARWINANGLTGIRWNKKRVWYMPKCLRPPKE